MGEHETGDAQGEESGSRGTPVGTPRPKRRKWLWILILVVLVLPALIMTAWAEIALHWSYSDGVRAGYVQKFSHKGWLCKTWEGEISMVNLAGAAQERFSFTVRDDSVANEITRLMGSRVNLSYTQHPGLPGSCFGETEYFVTGVTKIP